MQMSLQHDNGIVTALESAHKMGVERKKACITPSELSYLMKDLPDIKDRETLIYEEITRDGVEAVANRMGFNKSKYSYMQLAGRLLIYTLAVPKTVKEYATVMKHRLNEDTYTFLMLHHEALDKAVAEQKEADLNHDFFSASTLIRLYLSKPHHDAPPCESPQHMLLRIAVHWHVYVYDRVKFAPSPYIVRGTDTRPETLAKVIAKYKEMSNQLYTPASPVLFNAGTTNPQQASCFILTIGDSLHSIYANKYIVAMGSKNNGGWGIDASQVRHSEIGASGWSSGIVPMLKSYNDDIRYVDQGGKRKGAATITLRPHHIDVFEFISLADKVGDQYMRAHDLNLCLWCPWIFWQRVREDGLWTLFCPAKTSDLNDVYGKEFERRYVAAEKKEGLDKYKRVVKARDLYKHIIDIQRKAGMPYICHSDAANIKSNHRHNGYIRSPNLCLEVIHYTDEKTIGVCNLSSINLRAFARKKVPLYLPQEGEKSKEAYVEVVGKAMQRVLPDDSKGIAAAYVGEVKHARGDLTGTLEQHGMKETDVAQALREAYDFSELGRVTASVTENINMAMDTNKYPLDDEDSLEKGKIRRSNEQHRAIGIGVNGLAEAAHILDLPREHPYMRLFNKMIFACMYFNAVAKSIQLAIYDGKYPTFAGSPFSQGKLQFDLWAEEFKVRELKDGPVRKAADDIPIDPTLWGQKSIKLIGIYTPLIDHHEVPNVAGRQYERIIDIILPTWTDLKRCLIKYGCRNSMFLAPMPTASTAQILRNCESTEAHSSNMYSRKVLKGSYPVLVRGLVEDLSEIGLWNDEVANYIQASDGSVATLHTLVKNKYTIDAQAQARLVHIQRKYKTMWELSQKLLLTMAAEAGRYIDQSQSTNVWLKDCTDEKLQAIHLFTDELGLKTGMYYLRQGSQVEVIKFSMDSSILREVKNNSEPAVGVKEFTPTAGKDTKEIAGCPQENGVKIIEMPTELHDSIPSSHTSRQTPFNTPRLYSVRGICTEEVCLSCHS